MKISTLTSQSLRKDILKPDNYRTSIYSLLLSTMTINILSLALPIMTLQIYDRILPNPGSGTLPVLVAGVCLALFLESILRLARAYVIGRSGASYEHLMSCKTMSQVLNADLSRMSTYGTGEYLHRMNSVSKLKDFYNGSALTTIMEMIFVPVFLALIYFIAGPLAIVPTIILALFFCTSLWRGKKLRAAIKAREYADDSRFNFLIETLEGIHTVKSFALERLFERRYEALEEDSTLTNFRVTEETAGTFNTAAIFSHIMVACVITFGAVLVLQGTITTGSLIATLLLSGRMMQPVQKALALWTRYQEFTLGREHVREMLSTPQHPKPDMIERPALAEGKIEIQNLNFGFNESAPPLFKNLNLGINHSQAILINGSHGCGKTTLLNIIAGIYPAPQGTVTLDGRDILSYPSEILPRHVGMIRASGMIFRGTIRDNITCFGQINEAQAREVAALMRVDQDVAKLPGGFDTMLSGNNTDSIPPGLLQRIAIVRVLAGKPRLILFDNADRSLDKDGYSMIYSLLARLKGKASMILISDDRNIRALADRTYILENGALRETEEIYSRGNVKPYRELRL